MAVLSVPGGVCAIGNPDGGADNESAGIRNRGEPGTDRTASEFPAKGAGNPWQSCQSPEGSVRSEALMVGRTMKAPGSGTAASRGQTGLPANFRQKAPEIHGSLVSPRRGLCDRKP